MPLASALAQPSATAALVLQLPSSARALALGDAFVAVGNDEAAIFYNPAQLATLHGSAAGISVQGRAGALAEPRGSEMRPISFDGGLRASHLSVDYAYQCFETFGAMHRVGVRWWQ